MLDSWKIDKICSCPFIALALGLFTLMSSAHAIDLREACSSRLKSRITNVLDPKLALKEFADAKRWHPDSRDSDPTLVVQAAAEIIDPFGISLFLSDEAKLRSLIMTRSDLNDSLIAEFCFSTQENLQKLYDLIVKSTNFRGLLAARVDQLERQNNSRATEQKKARPSDLQEMMSFFTDDLASEVIEIKRLGVEGTDASAVVIRNFLRAAAKQYQLLSPSFRSALLLKIQMRSLDPHSEYLMPEEWQATYGRKSSPTAAFGVEMREVERGILIVSIRPDSPSERAGLKVGDVVTRLNGRLLRNRKVSEISAILGQFNPGESVRFDLSRPTAGDISIAVVGERPKTIFAQNVSAKLVDFEAAGRPSKAGVLSLRHFLTGSAEELQKKMEALEAQSSISAWILDLRGNPGGDVFEGNKVLSLFLREGILTRVRQLRKVNDYTADRKSRKFSQPLVVLIDDGTGSVSEQISGVLQEYGRALIAGSLRSNGKGTVQSYKPVADDVDGKLGGLKLTIGGNFLPSGRPLQKVGVEADVLMSTQPTGIVLERDRLGVLDFGAIESKLPRLYSEMPNRTTVVTEVVRAHNARVQQGGQSSFAVGETSELLEILGDYVPLATANRN